MMAILKNVRQRVEKLRAEIERHRYLYHVLDRQEISDAALDSLKHELDMLERQYPQLVTTDSPTQRVGGQPLPELRKVRHTQRMLSLEDAFSIDELRAWERRWQRIVPDQRCTYLVDLKLDGLAISVRYERGQLVQAATRGDGIIGEDVTHNVRTIESVPLRLRTEDLPPSLRRLVLAEQVEIRGEVVMGKDDFAQLNARQLQAGSPAFANPRNVAAGSIRQLDPRLAAARRLDFFAWELITDLGQRRWDEAYELIRKLGLKVNPRRQACRAVTEIEHFADGISERRDRLPFQIDGVVVKINELDVFQRAGIVGKAPRGAVALKFAAEQATTVIEDIQVQVGRTGVLTPVAHFRPVTVAGTTVARATLHNADEIARLGVHIGDTVIIQKAGDIIPEVVTVLKNLRPKTARPFRMPKTCPVCQTPIVRRPGEVAFVCPNQHCSAQRRERLYHFASKKALDILGLGPSTIDTLVDERLVRTPVDFFRLRPQQLVGLPLFAERKAEKLMAAISQARRQMLERFIYSLGIRHVGEETAIDLARHFRSVSRLMAAGEDEISQVENIGPIVAKSIASFFRHPPNRKMVEALLTKMDVRGPSETRSQKLYGRVIVVTGTLSTMSREEAHKKIRAAGGTVGSSVSPRTSYVVVGKNPGSKLSLATRLGVPTIDEADFRRMVQ